MYTKIPGHPAPCQSQESKQAAQKARPLAFVASGQAHGTQPFRAAVDARPVPRVPGSASRPHRPGLAAPTPRLVDWGTARLALPTGRLGVRSLDTPEQLDHSHHATLVGGAGGAVSAIHPDPRHSLQKRAGRKAISHALALALLRATGGPLMGNAYARTAHRCGERLDQSDGTLRQYWCGYRWCATCGAIRTARAHEAYGPTVAQWTDPQLVTLTVPNVTGTALRQAVRDMHHAFATLTRAVRRRFGKDGVRMIRTTEVTYNVGADSYHPHLHLLVDGPALAEAVRDAWLERWPTARRVAQDVRPADRNSMAEVFKYATKLATSDGKLVPAPALDTIYTALRGLRLWQPVGITALTDESAGDDTAEMDQTQGTPAISRPTETVDWQWQQAATDWVDSETGECLTGYTPTPRRAAFLAALSRMAADSDTARPARPAHALAAHPTAPRAASHPTTPHPLTTSHAGTPDTDRGSHRGLSMGRTVAVAAVTLNHQPHPTLMRHPTYATPHPTTHHPPSHHAA